VDKGGIDMYCCEEHIELAIDMYVDEKELAPEIEKIENNSKLSTSCELCTNPAVYIVGN
jgi:CxxH/CxxC protein (TIGR04129 family)